MTAGLYILSLMVVVAVAVVALEVVVVVGTNCTDYKDCTVNNPERKYRKELINYSVCFLILAVDEEFLVV